jgi:hypothetical protein
VGFDELSTVVCGSSLMKQRGAVEQNTADQ